MASAYTPFVPTYGADQYNPFSGFQMASVPYNDTQYQTNYKNFGGADPRTQGALTRATTQYQGDLTRGLLGSGFQNQMGGIEDLFDQYGKYGGVFGGGANAPVYSPQSRNGYGAGFAGSNPFKIGSF